MATASQIVSQTIALPTCSSTCLMQPSPEGSNDSDFPTSLEARQTPYVSVSAVPIRTRGTTFFKMKSRRTFSLVERSATLRARYSENWSGKITAPDTFYPLGPATLRSDGMGPRTSTNWRYK